MAHHHERQRASSFGHVAADYDSYRPSYPQELVEKILAGSANPERPSILDVGSGTGILAAQLRGSGAEVLAVEPNVRMADLAVSKGLNVEVDTFEEWDGAARTFDIVTFGQSYHWVDPAIAIPKLRKLLRPGGSIALAWNSIDPLGDLKLKLDAVHRRYAHRKHHENRKVDNGDRTSGASGSEASKEPASGSVPGGSGSVGPESQDKKPELDEHPMLREFRDAGFEVEQAVIEEARHYSRDQWIGMVFTYSWQLTMPKKRQEELRTALFSAIPDSGLAAHNTAILIRARPCSRDRMETSDADTTEA